LQVLLFSILEKTKDQNKKFSMHIHYKSNQIS
jgi:hypothetical protein